MRELTEAISGFLLTNRAKKFCFICVASKLKEMNLHSTEKDPFHVLQMAKLFPVDCPSVFYFIHLITKKSLFQSVVRFLRPSIRPSIRPFCYRLVGGTFAFLSIASSFLPFSGWKTCKVNAMLKFAKLT